MKPPAPVIGGACCAEAEPAAYAPAADSVSRPRKVRRHIVLLHVWTKNETILGLDPTVLGSIGHNYEDFYISTQPLVRSPAAPGNAPCRPARRFPARIP